MRERGIRFDGRPATVRHHSARGKVVRNAGHFTRGSQLLTHEVLMTWQGVKLPLVIGFFVVSILASLILTFRMEDHEIQLLLMKLYALAWDMVDFDPHHAINLTLPSDRTIRIPMGAVPYNGAVRIAWDKAMRCLLAAGIGATFLTVPLTIWFIDISRRRGLEILKERHERGAMLVERAVLLRELADHNHAELARELAAIDSALDARRVAKIAPARRIALGVPAPYDMAGLPYPWRLEQSHAMLIGTTGAGKTTQLRDLVRQARLRGHRCVIFDLTGAFVEAFYDPARDHILNPMDERCPPWTIFNDCENYADFTAAAAALIPSDGASAEPFWAMAARTLFVEMCVKLASDGFTSNGAIAHHLMHADLSAVHRMLENTIADPLTATQAARMAESIRAVFNTNAQVLRFLPDPTEDGLPPFSINRWMREQRRDGSILFITSTHTDLTLNRALLTLWMDMAVNALMRLERTRDLRTWFLFDEVHALHRLPAIEHGLQTARAFGGAFVLGMHSFDKLAETYGEQGAINLAALARTKLILTTGDPETARVCSEFIGDREVREMDEAYSYGYNNTRDASTLTPRTDVKPLMIPADIMNLPSLYGILKFPDGFPATRIRLEWRHYPEVAAPYRRRTTLTPVAWVPPAGPQSAAEGEGGAENVARADPAIEDAGSERTPSAVHRGVYDDLFAAGERRDVESHEPQAEPRGSGEGARPIDKTSPTPASGLAGRIGAMRAPTTGEARALDGQRGARQSHRGGPSAPRKVSNPTSGEREDQLGFGYDERQGRRGATEHAPSPDRDDGPQLDD